MIFDLISITGHHPGYIRHLVRYWTDHNLSGELYIVVLPGFVEKHRDITSLVAEGQRSFVKFVPISKQESISIGNRNTFLQKVHRNFKEWNLLCKYAKQLRIDHCLTLYIDTCEFPFLLGLMPPCPLSGIYFRPTFHYKSFSSYRTSIRDVFQHFRDKFFLQKTFSNPMLNTLFCLDPFASDIIRQMYPRSKVLSLVDPVDIPEFSSQSVENLRNQYSISSKRKIFLLIGEIGARKGIYKLLEALRCLSPHLCERICLLIVGSTSPSEKEAIQLLVDELCMNQPLQVITRFEYIAEEKISAYYQLSDIVVALYQRHAGMSGILLLAAASRKPVLSTDYGLMGEVVRRYKLGLAIDSTCVDSVLKAITHILEGNDLSYDLNLMKSFAQSNNPSKFAEIIFDNLIA